MREPMTGLDYHRRSGRDYLSPMVRQMTPAQRRAHRASQPVHVPAGPVWPRYKALLLWALTWL